MTPSRNAPSIKQSAPTGSGGLKVFRNSLLIGVAGVSPLLLYILLGPADGNPIGLGLLALVAVPVALIGTAIGAVTIVVERFSASKS